MKINNLFIPLDLSIKLKEKGFDETCFAFNSDNLETVVIPQGQEPNTFRANQYKSLVSRPLYQQVINWLYDTEGIWITIENNMHSDLPDSGFEFYVTVYGSCEIGRTKNGVFNNPTDALTKAIEESLNLIEE